MIHYHHNPSPVIRYESNERANPSWFVVLYNGEESGVCSRPQHCWLLANLLIQKVLQPERVYDSIHKAALFVRREW